MRHEKSLLERFLVPFACETLFESWRNFSFLGLTREESVPPLGESRKNTWDRFTHTMVLHVVQGIPKQRAEQRCKPLPPAYSASGYWHPGGNTASCQKGEFVD